jgi:hypothetical protein
MQSLGRCGQISGCKVGGGRPGGSIGLYGAELALNGARNQVLPFFLLFEVGKRVKQNTQVTETLKRNPVSPDASAPHSDRIGQPDGFHVAVFKIGPGYANIRGPSLADKDAARSELIDDFSVLGSSLERSAHFPQLHNAD